MNINNSQSLSVSSWTKDQEKLQQTSYLSPNKPSSYQPSLIIPYLKRKLSSSSQAKYAQIEIPISKTVISFLDQSDSNWKVGDFVLAAFSIYLARLSNSQEITLGLNQLSWQDLETRLVEDIPLLFRIEDKANFTTVATLIQKQLELTKQNPDIFSRYPQSTASETGEPLFSVKVAWQDNLNPNQYQSLARNSYLTLVISNQQQKCFWLYDIEAFNQESITRMLEQLTILIEGIILDRHCPIAQLPLLSPQQKHQLLVEWNNTHTDYPQDRCFHQLFEEQVAKNPEAIAVVFEKQQLTYQQLNQRANQLAHYLQKIGVQPETLVGICVEPSLEMVIGLLGILKAGGAYVPLDPNYPQERLTYMLDDSQLSILLTQEKLLARLPNSAAITCLDRDWYLIAQHNSDNPVSSVTTSNLAYVIYTSGSTGKPKGVLATHQGLPNLALAQAQVFGVKADSCVLQFASFSFDASISEIAMALVSGAKLCLAKKESLVPGLPLIRLCREQGITHITIAPSALAILPEEPIPSLEGIIVAGEACPAELVAKWSPGRRFFNAYGPTETTVCATIAECKDGTQKPSIGRPLANTQIYILDRNWQPVPVGVPGEIYIGSIGLARGYLHRPELTAERFIANPFAPESDSRLYRTGDLAKWLPQGEIEYLGRSDHQVKIRGFRIELEEIEAALTKHPDVLQTVALVREDLPGDKRIVAYVVAQANSNVSGTILRQFLQAKLPEYMLPSAIILLESVPLTPNGKVDKKALPAPDWSKLSQDYVAPRTATEKTLANIWSEVLGVERVGIYDKFFELGGHSLLATQIVSRIREVFKVELPLRYLLETSTIAQLTEVIATNPHQNSNLPISIAPRERGQDLPLSFAQSRMWFLYQLEGGGATYNISLVLNLLGSLDVTYLEKALTKVIERHEILRTSFTSTDGTTYQVVLPQLNIPISAIDFTEIPETEQLSAVKKLARQEVGRPFNLQEVPLLRVNLIQLSNTSQVLIVTVHHIISDGWSMGIFLEELSAYYQALITGNQARLAPLPIQYADFALWQRQYYTEAILAPQLEYWRKQLAGIPPKLELPSDRPRPAVQTFSGSSQSCQLSLELTEQLNNLSQKLGATLFMTLLAAFAVLMHRYSQQEDIVIGSPIANRNHSEIESLIGFFVNTLALRIDLTDNPTFTQLVDRVKQVALDAYAHQDLPFEKLVEELQPERHSSYHPLFQVMFVLQNTPAPDLQIPGLTIEPIEIENVTAKFDLTLSVTETKKGLQGTLEYKTDLFDAATISRMLNHWQMLLTAIVSNPEVSIARLPLLTAPEKQQLLIEWNQTDTDYPHDRCLHQLFEAQVENNPNAIAVVFENQTLTYQQLNEKANQLAHYLQTLGVQPEVLVGVALNRSVEMVISILAVLKAGGAYVPLDPTYPQERLAYMLEDSQLSILITQQQLLSQLPANKAQTICLDTDESLITRTSNHNPLTPVKPSNLAYIIYTSGSTGKPKGVLVTHRGIPNLAQAQARSFGITPESRVLQFASFSFDASISEIAMALVSGARICLAKKESLLPGSALMEVLRSYRITHVTLPPSALAVLPDEPLPDLKTIIVAGEACPKELVAQWSRGRSFFNAYGPTETTVCATIARCDDSTRKPTIGRPLPNTQIYILDCHLQPVPVGVTGEIYIHSIGLARGYLHRPQLTAERFIANPFEDKPDSHLYKTGDLARYLPNGEIEYLGRIDHQVKVRGFRIELGEIEATLLGHPEVNQAVVSVREDRPGNKRIVAYIVLEREITSASSQLRSFLQQSLPEYMLPSAFVVLESFPITPNGKIDRSALPIPDRLRQDLAETFIAPRDEIEVELTKIWSSILGVQPIGVKDNFFELGGHSLQAMHLFAQIQKAFNQEIPLATLFQAPTVESLANIIRQGGCTSRWSSLVEIQPKGAKPPLFIIVPGATTALQLADLVRHLGSQQPVYSLQAPNLEKDYPNVETIEQLAAHYIKEMLTLDFDGPYLLAGRCGLGTVVAFEMALQLQAQGKSVALVAMLDPTYEAFSNAFQQPEPKNKSLIYYLDRLVYHWQRRQLFNIVSHKIPGLKIFPKTSQENTPDKSIAPEPIATAPNAERLQAVLKSQKAAYRKYIPKRIYQGQIALILSEYRLKFGLVRYEDWHQLATQGFERFMVPGHHSHMLSEPNVRFLAEKITLCIDRAINPPSVDR